jgi:hypothetical protein
MRAFSLKWGIVKSGNQERKLFGLIGLRPRGLVPVFWIAAAPKETPLVLVTVSAPAALSVASPATVFGAATVLVWPNMT